MNLDFYLNKTSRFNARCSAIIFNNDKTKVLVFKINDGRDYYLIPGGRIEFNETSLDAIKREIKEETGFDLNYNLLSIHGINLMAYLSTIAQVLFLNDSFKVNYNEKTILDGLMSNPDIYKIEYEEKQVINITRIALNERK
ncbi:MAG: NUDIX domain-containing protein [bacterium]|nr:NUDIX domain-containing protein [bacterium]